MHIFTREVTKKKDVIEKHNQYFINREKINVPIYDINNSEILELKITFFFYIKSFIEFECNTIATKFNRKININKYIIKNKYLPLLL